MNTPFTYTKQVASDFGGTRNGMVVHWPKGIKAKGEVRSQFGHVVDIAPTIYEAAKLPARRRLTESTRTHLRARALSIRSTTRMQRKHTPCSTSKCSGIALSTATAGMHAQFTVRHGGVRPTNHCRKTRGSFTTRTKTSLTNNVASSNDPKLKELQALFMAEAEKYHVLPIDDRLLERLNAELVGRPTVMEGRNSITYGPGMKGMGVDIFIDTRGKSYTMTADVEIKAGDNGVIVAQGGRFGGFSFYLKGGKRRLPTTFWALRNGTSYRHTSVRVSIPSYTNSNPRRPG